MATKLFEDVIGAGDLNSQLGVLRPAFREWNSGQAVADRRAHDNLTSVLIAIYAFGLDALRQRASLKELGWKHQTTFPKEGSNVNVWLPLLKVATGDFHPSETVERTDPTNTDKKVRIPKFAAGTALEKYAIALRALETAKVRVEDVESYVCEFAYVSGTVRMGRWAGIMAADRKARKDAGLTTGRNMHDAAKLQRAVRALLTSEAVPVELRKSASADNAEVVAMWGFKSGDLLVPGGRIEGGIFDAKAKTLAVAFADAASVENDEEDPAAPGEATELEDAG
jgi:hypothetical protein